MVNILVAQHRGKMGTLIRRDVAQALASAPAQHIPANHRLTLVLIFFNN
ncbi:hypothetical protein MuYL_4284 [Mucilaginibacter xinganensis]|uniref:Uncharacterized protein n=1 Tax=Mucilaginibacter xinganensis TaxID=1234841 RepID=A0A223P1Z2_9SPHI|nr:hypothetical protein MuYL_4284 [Mucilaginibacter xinganensis]